MTELCQTPYKPSRRAFVGYTHIQSGRKNSLSKHVVNRNKCVRKSNFFFMALSIIHVIVFVIVIQQSSLAVSRAFLKCNILNF